MNTLFDTVTDDEAMPWEIEPPDKNPEDSLIASSTTALGDQVVPEEQFSAENSTNPSIVIPAFADPSTTVVTPLDPKLSGLSEGVRQKVRTNLFEKALCLAVTITKPGNSKKLPSSAVEVDSDKDRIRVNKVLIESPTYKAISSLDGEIRNWLYTRCLPCGLLKSGIYLLPIVQVDMAEERMTDFCAQRAELIETFIGEYDGIVAQAKEALKANFDQTDYPPKAKLRTLFVFEWSYVSIGTPTALSGVSKALYDREKEKAESKLADAAETVQQALRVAMADLVDRAVDRLGGTTATGRKKGFGPATVEKINEFLDTFQARNLTGDDQMESLVTKAKDLLRGVDVKTLKKDDAIRETVKTGFEEIAATLDTMVVERPTRAFALDEDEE